MYRSRVNIRFLAWATGLLAQIAENGYFNFKHLEYFVAIVYKQKEFGSYKIELLEMLK